MKVYVVVRHASYETPEVYGVYKDLEALRNSLVNNEVLDEGIIDELLKSREYLDLDTDTIYIISEETITESN